MRGTPGPGCENENVPPTRAQQARAARIAAQIAGDLAQAGFILPGTLTERMTRCGRANCRCHAGPPRLHGPYHQWTRKVNGKTVTRILTDDQLADYQPVSAPSWGRWTIRAQSSVWVPATPAHGCPTLPGAMPGA